jgi:outer membrane immunogenic protein
MKAFVAGSVALMATIAAPAMAADMPVKAPLAPTVIPYSWAGFYVGGNVGYSWGRSSSSFAFIDPASGAVLSASNDKFNLNGVIGGVQIGHNWQTNNWVWGLEADFQGSGQKGNAGAACAGGSLSGTPPFSGACTVGHVGDTPDFNVAALPVGSALEQKLDWFGTVRGRIGPAITPTILIYATGGLAYGRVRSTYSVSGTNITGGQGTNTVTLTPVAASFGDSTTKIGWTVGAGLEGVLSGNWTGKIEYIYVDLGTVSGAFVTPIVLSSGAFLTSSYRSHITDNIVRVGLNYRFGDRAGRY